MSLLFFGIIGRRTILGQIVQYRIAIAVRNVNIHRIAQHHLIQLEQPEASDQLALASGTMQDCPAILSVLVVDVELVGNALTVTP
jgi:hypothetical protein